MMCAVRSACGLSVCASDGPLGALADIHFHDTLYGSA
jgi:hypothetical protein